MIIVCGPSMSILFIISYLIGAFEVGASLKSTFCCAIAQKVSMANTSVLVNFFIIFKLLLQYSNFRFISLVIFIKKDRKSTRLNSSHVKISYAVFCLK